MKPLYLATLLFIFTICCLGTEYTSTELLFTLIGQLLLVSLFIALRGLSTAIDIHKINVLQLIKIFLYKCHLYFKNK